VARRLIAFEFARRTGLTDARTVVAVVVVASDDGERREE